MRWSRRRPSALELELRTSNGGERHPGTLVASLPVILFRRDLGVPCATCPMRGGAVACRLSGCAGVREVVLLGEAWLPRCYNLHVQNS